MIQRKTLQKRSFVSVPCSTSTFFLTAKNRFNSLFIIEARQLCDVIIELVGRQKILTKLYKAFNKRLGLSLTAKVIFFFFFFKKKKKPQQFCIIV